ncbi:MAG TPA: GNAT family N-acetyltransferase [Thermoleophilaceae bacterium]
MEVLDRMLRSMRAAWQPVADWQERDGVGSVLTEAVPQRSIVNSVIYQPGADIAGAYDWLESRYAGVEAWTVWVPETERATAELLESRGHKLDEDPAMMVCELASFEPPAELPHWQRGTIEDVARINDAAYPWRDGSMERALLGSQFGDNLHIYVTEGASTLGILDCEGDASVIFVATLPEARGRGLAGRLLAAALAEARERGNDISTLQATKMGEPIYARLGYERFGAIEMWEKRKT